MTNMTHVTQLHLTLHYIQGAYTDTELARGLERTPLLQRLRLNVDFHLPETMSVIKDRYITQLTDLDVYVPTLTGVVGYVLQSVLNELFPIPAAEQEAEPGEVRTAWSGMITPQQADEIKSMLRYTLCGTPPRATTAMTTAAYRYRLLQHTLYAVLRVVAHLRTKWYLPVWAAMAAHRELPLESLTLRGELMTHAALLPLVEACPLMQRIALYAAGQVNVLTGRVTYDPLPETATAPWTSATAWRVIFRAAILHPLPLPPTSATEELVDDIEGLTVLRDALASRARFLDTFLVAGQAARPLHYPVLASRAGVALDGVQQHDVRQKQARAWPGLLATLTQEDPYLNDWYEQHQLGLHMAESDPTCPGSLLWELACEVPLTVKLPSLAYAADVFGHVQDDTDVSARPLVMPIQWSTRDIDL